MKKKRILFNRRLGSVGRIHPQNFALAGAIVITLCAAIITFTGTYGYFPFSNMIIADLYSNFGYSLDFPAVILGSLYVFIDSFILFWLLVLIYNRLNK